ncbi:MAG: hypothetical protein B6D64_00065 [Bacteroidetes bacterium 4484_276]|nr:MAG: hypothetical protein B6D64_00065 [Bacteroidetes bacterium 4484_276]
MFIAAVLLFYFFSNGFIAEKALRLWEMDKPFDSSDQKKYDVGIVLSGGLVKYDEKNNKLVYGQSSDRIIQALKMYNTGVIRKIMISGGSGSLLKTSDNESELMRRFLINLGIPNGDIVIEPNSRNTHENAIETKKLLNMHFPDGRYLLFTSALHMRRANACFKKEGIKVDTYGTNNVIVKKNPGFSFLFIPSALSIYQWESLSHEIVGYISYKIAGYA